MGCSGNFNLFFLNVFFFRQRTATNACNFDFKFGVNKFLALYVTF